MRRRTWVVLAGLVLALAGGAFLLVATVLYLPTLSMPTVTCSGASPSQCRDTAAMFEPLSFDLIYPPLPSRVRSMELRSAPPEWAASPDPGGAQDRWAATVELDNGQRVLAECFYSSDRIVSCDVVE